jgi:AAA domain
VNLFVSKRKMGKSHIIADYAARTSQGWASPPYDPLDPTAPEGNTPGQVILVTPEDDSRTVVKPRLIAAGADTTKILDLSHIERGSARNADTTRSRFSIPGDFSILQREIQNAGDVRLVVLDPLMAISTKTVAFNLQLRMNILDPLQQMCRETGVTMIVTTHFNKGVTLTNIEDRVNGSGGLLDALPITNVIIDNPFSPGVKVLMNLLNRHMSSDDLFPIEYTIGGESPRSFIRYNMPRPLVTADTMDRLQAFIIAVLLDAGHPMTSIEIASFTRLPHETVRALLKKSEKQHAVQKHRGAYTANLALLPSKEEANDPNSVSHPGDAEGGTEPINTVHD